MTQDGKNRTSALPGLGALAFVLGLAFPSNAAAQTACGDTTCPKGYACESVPAGCPAIACAPGSNCPPCDDAVLACVAEPCASDADCDVDMVCLSETITECSGSAPACEPGRECAPPPPAECETIERSQCVPRWALPCQTSANCGAGFECVEQEDCSCSGSSGGSGGSASGGGSQGSPTPAVDPVPPSNGGAANGGAAQPRPPSPGNPAPPQPEPAEVPPEDAAPSSPLPPDTCECKPSGARACQVIERACEVDSDCPARWSCEDNPEGVCWSGPDGSGCEPGDPPKLCLPPYRSLGGYPGRGENSGGVGTPTSGNPEPSPEPGAPPVAPPGPTEDPNAELDRGPDASDGGGCTLAQARTGGASGALFAAMAALAFAVRRRRDARPRA